MSETKILTFGVITEIIGKKNIAIGNVSSTQELQTLLEDQYPRLKEVKYAIAIDRKIITHSMPIDGNSIIALLPPFSGG